MFGVWGSSPGEHTAQVSPATRPIPTELPCYYFIECIRTCLAKQPTNIRLFHCSVFTPLQQDRYYRSPALPATQTTVEKQRELLKCAAPSTTAPASACAASVRMWGAALQSPPAAPQRSRSARCP